MQWMYIYPHSHIKCGSHINVGPLHYEREDAYIRYM